MVVADSGAILDFLAKGEPVRPGGVGAIGYCMGGRHVLCVAGQFSASGSGYAVGGTFAGSKVP